MNPINPLSSEILRRLATERPPGNCWFKVNLHAHGKGSTAADMVASARAAQLDLIAITDHQTFDYYDAILKAAAAPGRQLTVLPGIEITTHEGVHLLAVFPATYSIQQREQLLGWLELSGSGDTNIASRRTVLEVWKKVEDEEGGIIIVPLPFAPKIGLLDSSRKMSTKLEWLESGHIRLFQVSKETFNNKIRFIDRDENRNWINRFVLESANEKQIAESTYCLAPFNRSDAHEATEVGEGCSWFRMQELSIEGLKQVACEPKTRISWTEPDVAPHDAILALRTDKGYCRGEIFRFNDTLNCLVGSNYSGKSTVLDLIRFTLQHEYSVPKESREKLLTRLYGTLGDGGTVELFVRKDDNFYMLRRTFAPKIRESLGEIIVAESAQPFSVYRYDTNSGNLVPTDDFTFPIEVYEQGRISRLRDDLPRQLEMLDEFAHLGNLKKQRNELTIKLNDSANHLYPLYEEREQLKSELAGLPGLINDLKEKEKLLPDEKEEQLWANATTFAKEMQSVLDILIAFRTRVAEPDKAQAFADDDELAQLFGQVTPNLDEENIVEANLLAQWQKAMITTLNDIAQARKTINTSIDKLTETSENLKKQWIEKRNAHDKALSTQLAAAGVESPTEMIRLVGELRGNIHNLKNKRKPRLKEVEQLIKTKEDKREELIQTLDDCDCKITATREQKAKSLTDTLGDYIRIELEQAADRKEYAKLLDQLVSGVSTSEHQIKNREEQLRTVIKNVKPLELAAALAARGKLTQTDGFNITLVGLCGITENTQKVLCSIADNIKLLNRLVVVPVPDILRIKVRRLKKFIKRTD